MIFSLSFCTGNVGNKAPRLQPGMSTLGGMQQNLFAGTHAAQMQIGLFVGIVGSILIAHLPAIIF